VEEGAALAIRSWLGTYDRDLPSGT
jgi:hypothetical protein